MEINIEIAHFRLAIFLVIFGLAEVQPLYKSCPRIGSAQTCYHPFSSMCCDAGLIGSSCCSSVRCGLSLCTKWSTQYCCYSSSCCDSYQYQSSSLSSSMSYWSSWGLSLSRSTSSSSSSFWRSWSWSKSRAAREREEKARDGIIAGSVVGGIVFLLIVVVVPVCVCRKAAERSNNQAVLQVGQRTQQTPYLGGPQIAGAMPEQPQQTNAAAPSVDYSPPNYPGQQYPSPPHQYPPSTNPAYQPSAPTEMPMGQQQPCLAPPPSYDEAVAMIAKP